MKGGREEGRKEGTLRRKIGWGNVTSRVKVTSEQLVRQHFQLGVVMEEKKVKDDNYIFHIILPYW